MAGSIPPLATIMGRNTQEYSRAYSRQRYSRFKSKVFAVLGNACRQCGSRDRLQVDHIDPALKSFTISEAYSMPWDSVVEELTKCQPLCSKCHKTKTDNEQRGPAHGTFGSYRNARCRCKVCKAFVAVYFRKWQTSR